MPRRLLVALIPAFFISSGLAADPDKPIDWSKAREHWSFQTLVKPHTPMVRDSAWVRGPIDRFILSKLEEKGLKPVAPAGKHELIRRATFDLIGLPPTPDEVEAFVADHSPDAFARVVDRLLKSPHYGERWGRHWLDVARYAEDQAHTFGVKPYTEAWRYRDWVIAAFNADMPYDRFVKLQIAADLMELSEHERRAHLPALGFFGLGAQYYGTNNAKAAADELDDRVDTVTRGLLGLTVSCARCHDHKYDPIPTQDYYSLAGVFLNTKLVNLPLGTAAEVKRLKEYEQKVKTLDESVTSTLRRERAKAAVTPATEVAKYMRAAWQFQGRRATDAKFRLAEQASSSGVDPAELARWVKFLDGNPKMPALANWMRLPRDAKDAEVGKTAEEFQKQVEQIVAESVDKPLNKQKSDLIQALFGDKGLHPLGDDGLKKQMPAAQRQELERSQEELKRLQKAPVLLPQTHGLAEAGSSDMKVYERGNPAKQGEVAPRRFLRILAGDQPKAFTAGSGRRELAECIASRDNPLFARVMVNRIWGWHFGRGLVGTPSNFGKLGERPTHPELLDYLAARFMASGGQESVGWSIKALHREIMLSAVYQLSSDRDEASEAVDADNRLRWRADRRRLDIESWRDALLAVSGQLDSVLGGPTFELSANQTRRTVYAKVSRHNLDGLLRLFDFPEANLTCERRSETTVPQQQLFVLNAPFMLEMARALARRLQEETGDDTARVRRMFALAFGRSPSAEEVEAALQFLRGNDNAEERSTIKLTRWERLAQVVLSSNEFMYLD